MRTGHVYQCRATAPIRLITAPEWFAIRDAAPVPVIPGRPVMPLGHPRPAYVPRGAKYVSSHAKPIFTTWQKAIILGCVAFFLAVAAAAVLIIDPIGPSGVQPAYTSTPSTIAPPPPPGRKPAPPPDQPTAPPGGESRWMGDR